MSTLYWLTILGNISFVSFIAAMVFIVSCIILIPMSLDKELSSYHYILKKAWKISLTGLIISLAVCVLIPSKNELYAIYGVGSVIDYAKNSKEVQKLPDNAVKALNAYLENIQKEDSTDNKGK